jgi:hypothetical protein
LVDDHERVNADKKCVRATPHCLEGGHDIFRPPDFEDRALKPERAGGCLNLVPLQCTG